MKRTVRFLALATAATIAVGCGEKEDEQKEAITEGFPGLHAIALEGMFASSTTGLTTAAEDCDKSSDYGLFGMPIGAACHTAPFAANLLLGENLPEDFTCEDWTENNDDYGILVDLTCDPDFPDGIKSLAFEEDGEAFAISFEAYDNSDAVGVWNRGGVGSYPSDMRLWSGSSFDDLAPLVAIRLTSKDEGSIQIAGMPDAAEGTGFQMKIDFKNSADTSGCEAAPSKETCHWQQTQIFHDNDFVESSPPNGFNTVVLADGKSDPSFITIEGNMRYNDSFAAGSFSSTADQAIGLGDSRGIYFQSFKKGDQIYGSFDFTDANGDTLSNALFATLKSGLCLNIEDEDDTPDTCDAADESAYSSIWQGSTVVDGVESSPVDADFDTGKPTEQGMVQ